MLKVRDTFLRSHSVSLPAKTRAALVRIDKLFLLTVILPTLLATLYFGLLASDVYVSESQFVVRSPDKPATTGLGVLLKSTGFSNAGDEVYAEEASLIGSIGVVTSSFGAHRLIERFGIERRLHTAGENKAMLDPFLPEDPEDVARLTVLQQDIHDSFKEHVRRRRLGKIDPADDSLFSGEVLTGRMALARGLVDGIGDLRSVMRARFGDKVRLRPVAAERKRRWWLPRLLPAAGAEPIAAAVAEAIDRLEARALWARFGL